MSITARRMWLVRLRICPAEMRPSESRNVRRSAKVTRLPMSRKTATAATMNPTPPNCIRTRITIWPNRERSWPGLMTFRPVVATAETAVNNASFQVNVRSAPLMGSASKTVPTAASAASPPTSPRPRCDCDRRGKLGRQRNMRGGGRLVGAAVPRAPGAGSAMRLPTLGNLAHRDERPGQQ